MADAVLCVDLLRRERWETLPCEVVGAKAEDRADPPGGLCPPRMVLLCCVLRALLVLEAIEDMGL